MTYCYINRLSVRSLYCNITIWCVSNLLWPSLTFCCLYSFLQLLIFLQWWITFYGLIRAGHHHPLISFLRFWTHNWPFSDFLWLAYDICNTTQPHSAIMVTPGSCNMCYATLPHIWHCGLERTMCFTMLSIIGPTIQISFQGMHCYIWYLEVQLQGGMTLVCPSC